MLHGTIEMQSDDQAYPGGCLATLSATIGAGGEDDIAARRAVAARRAEDRSGIEECLRRGRAIGAIRGDLDPETATVTVHSFVLGVSTQLLDDVAPAALHSAADLVIDALRADNSG